MEEQQIETVAAALHSYWLANYGHFGDADTTPWEELTGESRKYGLGLAKAAIEATQKSG